jgi:hypothetical protein
MMPEEKITSNLMEQNYDSEERIAREFRDDLQTGARDGLLSAVLIGGPGDAPYEAWKL